MKRVLEAILFLAVVGITATMASRFVARRHDATLHIPPAASYQGEDVEPGSKVAPRPLTPNEHSVGGFPGSSDSPLGSHRPGAVPPPTQ